MVDDAALLRSFVETRSEGAFSELVRRHVDLVYSAALRQVAGDSHRAEDVTQTVFTLLARKAGSLTGHAALAGWLFTTARFTAGETMRAERRRRHREQVAMTMQDLDSSPEPEADWYRVRSLIDDAVAALNGRDREAVVLRFFDRRCFADVARLAGLTEDAARMRVDRALDKLRAHLARRGITSTSAALATSLAQAATITAPTGLAARIAGLSIAAGGGWTWSALSNLLKAPMTTAATGLALGIAALGLVTHESGQRKSAQAAHDAEAARLTTGLRRAEARLGAFVADPIEETDARASRRAATEPPRSARADDVGMAIPAGESIRAARLDLRNASHVAFVIDTSGSMRDPAGEGLKPQVVRQVEYVLAGNTSIEFVQFLDADGRYILGRPGSNPWMNYSRATQKALVPALARYGIQSNSSPLPGMIRAIRQLAFPKETGIEMSLVVLGDEFAAKGETDALDRLDQLNPADANGHRGVSINAVGFRTPELPQPGEEFAKVMDRIAREHGGVFVPAP
jgi:RNA polymerase sigma factor (sigma-70 family)